MNHRSPCFAVRVVCASPLIVSLAGCGDAAPPDAPGAEGDYYPMVDGSVAIYRHSNDGGWDETVTLSSDGDGVFSELDTPSPDGKHTESIQEVDEHGSVWRTAKSDYVDGELDISVVYAPGFVRFDPAWLGLEPNESVRIAYDRTETPAGGVPDTTRDRAHIYTSYGYETVTVLGKSYHDCLVIRRERDYQDTLGNSEDQQKQFYFAPGVGKVREVNLDSGSTEELVSYDDG